MTALTGGVELEQAGLVLNQRRSYAELMLSSYEITELWRYPVKSMGGESLDRVDVGPGGVVGDRKWALRNTETNKITAPSGQDPTDTCSSGRPEPTAGVSL